MGQEARASYTKRGFVFKLDAGKVGVCCDAFCHKIKKCRILQVKLAIANAVEQIIFTKPLGCPWPSTSSSLQALSRSKTHEYKHMLNWNAHTTEDTYICTYGQTKACTHTYKQVLDWVQSKPSSTICDEWCSLFLFWVDWFCPVAMIS